MWHNIDSNEICQTFYILNVNSVVYETSKFILQSYIFHDFIIRWFRVLKLKGENAVHENIILMLNFIVEKFFDKSMWKVS